MTRRGQAPTRRRGQAPSARRGQPARAGFTLIEVLVSMAILTGMVTLVWSSFSISANAKRDVEAIEARYHQIRLAANRMAREISMAFLSKNEQMGALKPRTMFIGVKNSSVDELTFSALAHVVLRENAKESDQSVIRYYAAPDPDNRGQTNLMRRESRRLGDENPGEEGPAYVILENIEDLHYEYFDEQQNEWRETWNTTSVDGQPDRLPSKVRIYLTVGVEGDREITLPLATRIFLQDPLWFSAGQ